MHAFIPQINEDTISLRFYFKEEAILDRFTINLTPLFELLNIDLPAHLVSLAPEIFYAEIFSKKIKNTEFKEKRLGIRNTCIDANTTHFSFFDKDLPSAYFDTSSGDLGLETIFYFKTPLLEELLYSYLTFLQEKYSPRIQEADPHFWEEF